MEVLIRVVDRAGFDPVRNAVCLRPGDVVCVVPDGWNWSQKELTNKDWRIVKLPNVDYRLHSDLLMPAYDANGKLLVKRAIRIDISDTQLANFIASGEQIITFSTNPSINRFLNLKRTKTLQVTVG